MNKDIDIRNLATEQRNPRSEAISHASTLEMVKTINEEDKSVALAVEKQLPNIAEAVDAIFARFDAGGRIIYCGSGTSGRLGVLDATELKPTYGLSPERAFGIIAGGKSAMFDAVEGAEDSAEAAAEDLASIGLSPQDALISIAASGRTPYGISALAYAKSVGALAVSLTCTPENPMKAASNIAIAIDTGPEVVTGSTRMKAGTAQKMVLNMLSTCVMIKSGKVYSNLMVNVQPTNHKLIDRATNMIAELTSLPREEASALLTESGNSVATAILMQKASLGMQDAQALLAEHKGKLSEALKSWETRGER